MAAAGASVEGLMFHATQVICIDLLSVRARRASLKLHLMPRTAKHTTLARIRALARG